VISERTTASRHSPSYVHRSDHALHHRAVASIRLGLDRPGLRAARRIPGEREGHPLPGRDREVGQRVEVLAAQRDGCAEIEGARAADRAQTVGRAAHPRYERAVVRPQDQIGAHRHPATQAFDHADDGGRLRSLRHAVEQPDRAGLGLELGFEHERAGPIAPAHIANRGCLRRDLPAAVLRRPEQRGEARG